MARLAVGLCGAALAVCWSTPANAQQAVLLTVSNTGDPTFTRTCNGAGNAGTLTRTQTYDTSGWTPAQLADAQVAANNGTLYFKIHDNIVLLTPDVTEGRAKNLITISDTVNGTYDPATDILEHGLGTPMPDPYVVFNWTTANPNHAQTRYWDLLPPSPADVASLQIEFFTERGARCVTYNGGINMIVQSLASTVYAYFP